MTWGVGKGENGGMRRQKGNGNRKDKKNKREMRSIGVAKNFSLGHY